MVKSRVQSPGFLVSPPLHILPEYIQATVICGIDSEASLMTIIDGFVSFIDVPLQLPIIREAGVG